MTVIVTGLECSGTKWMTEMLQRHPEIRRAVHTSIPEYLTVEHGFTRWPDLTGANRVVWVIRYEPFRLKAVERNRYNAGRAPEFLPPKLYKKAEGLFQSVASIAQVVSYEGLVGPFGQLVFRDLLLRMRIRPECPFDPKDANRKYLAG